MSDTGDKVKEGEIEELDGENVEKEKQPVDAIVEVRTPQDENDNNQELSKNTNGKLHSNIEGDMEDPAQQVAFLVQGLSTREKRRTFTMLEPELQSFLTSTMIDTGDNSAREPPAERKQQPETLYTSGGEVTLGANSSVSKIVFQAPRVPTTKLRLFSGVTPAPKGEVDFRTWSRAAKRLSKKTDLTDEEKCERLQNSLLDPALSIVQAELDAAHTSKVISLLEKNYEEVKDVRELLNEFHNSNQLPSEKSSEFANRLYLQLQELQRRRAAIDLDVDLLKQFIYGCSDESLVLKLRLEERDEDHDPPDYGSLLLSIRREEARRERKRTVAKQARAQQMSETASKRTGGDEYADAACALRKEVTSLRAEVAQLKQQRAPEPVAQVSVPVYRPTENQGKSSNQKRGLNFCFQCGQDSHKVYTCSNTPNPALVAQKFQEVRKWRQQQENKQGSR